MSMNLRLKATVKAYSKVGNHIIQETFNLRQTPTGITHECINSKNPLEEYLKWINQYNKINKIPIYEDDLINDGPIIGYEEYNYVEEHLKELKKWLEEYKDWDITWYAL